VTGVLELLAGFVEQITAWLPRPFLVNVTERGVRFRRGQDPTVVDPGLRCKVPISSTVEVVSLLRDTSEFPPVTLTTKDGITVALGIVIVWAIDDPLKAVTTTDDLVAMVGDVGESLLPEIVLAMTWEEVLAAAANRNGREWSLNRRLAADAQRLLDEYGVRVISARVNSLARARVLRLIQ
jgi:regulator of protease activity HflC (stomatin/prohibitin superfamily)